MLLFSVGFLLQEIGKLYGEPQPIASLRLGSMWQWGLVPYMGVNITKAVECYQEVTSSEYVIYMYIIFYYIL